MKNEKINANKIKMYLTTQIATMRTFLDSQCRLQCVISTIRMKRDRCNLSSSPIVTVRDSFFLRRMSSSIYGHGIDIYFVRVLAHLCSILILKILKQQLWVKLFPRQMSFYLRLRISVTFIVLFGVQLDLKWLK